METREMDHFAPENRAHTVAGLLASRAWSYYHCGAPLRGTEYAPIVLITQIVYNAVFRVCGTKENQFTGKPSTTRLCLAKLAVRTVCTQDILQISLSSFHSLSRQCPPFSVLHLTVSMDSIYFVNSIVYVCLRIFLFLSVEQMDILQ